MKIRFIDRLRGRLFLKILALFSLGIILAIIIPVFTRHIFFHPGRFPEMQKNAISHSQYIINDLGNPPSTEKALKVSEILGIQMRFETRTQKWASTAKMPDFDDFKLPSTGNRNTYAGFTRYGFCVRIDRPDSRFLLVMRPRLEELRKEAGFFALAIMGFITVLIIAMYILMRRLLKPIKVLDEGVKQLSEGNLDYEMSTGRTDELGKLIQSFNHMTGRIRSMLRSRDRLLLDVSHELRSPLTRMRIALEFLENSEIKKNIRDDINELETKITELLETERLDSKYGKLKLVKSNICELIREVRDGFLNQKPGIRMVSFPKNVCLKVDRERIKILFRNILDNAIRYSDPDSYPVEISLREKPDEYTIAVQDFGKGIPEQEIPFIFEPFYRVDKSRSKKTGGYGLGMSLSKKIMDAHGGIIEVSSRPEVGTTIFLKFKK
jgi:signal transduction histidine kinase